MPDPHYGLGVVVCPGCRTPVVRQRHPDRVYWQQMRRLRQSLRQLFLALMFTALITGAIIGMIFWVKPVLTTRTGSLMMPDFSEPRVVSQLLSAGVLVLLCGCIARPLYAHRHFWIVLGFFSAFFAFFLYLDVSIGALLIFVRDLVGSDMSITQPKGWELKRRLVLLAPAIVLFTLGLGLGSAINVLIERGSGRRIVKLRRKLRRRRGRQD